LGDDGEIAHGVAFRQMLFSACHAADFPYNPRLDFYWAVFGLPFLFLAENIDDRSGAANVCTDARDLRAR
jgi:hypothetical protein